MHVNALTLLALPLAVSATSNLANVGYIVPEAFLNQDNSCVMPANFEIRNFIGVSNSTGPVAPLVNYNFTFVDTATSITTSCQYNSSSVSDSPPDYTPRYACDNQLIKFIWLDNLREMTMIEGACPGLNGNVTFEASGSVFIGVNCGAPGSICGTSSNNLTGKYYSLEPVPSATRVEKKWAGIPKRFVPQRRQALKRGEQRLW